MSELSLFELERELSAELPARTLMCRRKVVRRAKKHVAPSHSGGGTSASANNGSVANANSTKQIIFNPQVAVVLGANTSGGAGALQGNGALVSQLGANANGNGNTQFGVPVNFQA